MSFNHLLTFDDNFMTNSISKAALLNGTVGDIQFTFFSPAIKRAEKLKILLRLRVKSLRLFQEKVWRVKYPWISMNPIFFSGSFRALSELLVKQEDIH